MNPKDVSVKRLPAEVFHPSEYIRDEMAARRWTMAELAVMMRVAEKRAAAIASGAVRVSPMIAAQLAQAFGTSATVWYRMQRTYDAGPAKGT